MPVGDDNDGGTCENWACNPGALLYAICRKSGAFRSLMRRQLQQHPCSSAVPWNLLLYFDGISPRDPLAKGKNYRGMDAGCAQVFCRI
eukprot:8983882-Pyramimonas_sp.AAC.1